ncbi:uncharacterized protein LOC132259280 [Phlebotomus argentipes]|uniref:uncharacterized protein LOC132259280 n=1 Tax=Phlebotomus argentipes TaxID=94469 RepID=UPI002892CDEB|nr:uncharacterized protein LOC132259280 [Phlebotomus argentipes]
MFPSRHLIATGTALGAVAIADIVSIDQAPPRMPLTQADALPKVSGRYCEGGHRCSAPKECCAQGCCYLYAPPSPPRTVPPAADHVLNLFFINHWYFWCLVLAIILALLCACSLWKKRRQLCGWGVSGAGHSTHSEGDSAGSCYAPPQYSRCSSFHHAPPPYTEVTSKPDLYPLVFSCNGDSGKNGANYLMVQYFRNYIVRPLGSISATSTVDSLSSSFICTVNEANSLVPPPYSRAASPDATTTISINRAFPRSASQHATFAADPHHLRPANSVPGVMNCVQPGTSEDGSTPCLRFSDSTNFPYLSGGSQHQPSPGTVTLNISQSEHHIQALGAGQSLATSATSAASNNVLCSPSGQSVPASGSVENFHHQNYEDLSALRRNLEKCCHILQKQHPSGPAKFPLTPGEKSPSALEAGSEHYGGLRTFVNSNMDSAVSSLTNIESPMSPPQAISPTDEVRELLEQIKQLQSTTSALEATEGGSRSDQRRSGPPGQHAECVVTPETYTVGTRRSLFGKSTKSAYIPFSSVRETQRSPTGQRPTSFLILAKGYPYSGKRSWISRSAPTTPGTALPTTNQLTEDSPLLDEHDEEEQNV